MGLHTYINIITTKTKSFLGLNKISLSALVINSKINNTASLRQNVRFYNSSLDKYSYIGRNSLIQNTDIGSFCSISESCNIGMPSHPITMVSISPVFLKGSNVLKKNFSQFEHEACPKTQIGSDVWLGANVSVKSGIRIGHGAIIGSGAIVTHDVPPYEIWVGNPARCIKKRFDDETIERLLKSKWWNFDEKELQECSQFFNNPQEFLQFIEENKK